MKLRKRKNLEWIFIWLSSLFIKRKVNERYIAHATEIFHNTDTELKLKCHRWVETFADSPGVNLCGTASVSTHFKVSLRIQYHSTHDEMCESLPLSFVTPCLRVYLKLVLRCGHVWTSIRSCTRVRVRVYAKLRDRGVYY